MSATHTINVAKRDTVPSAGLFRETILDIFQELGAATQIDAVTLLRLLVRDFEGLSVATIACLISQAGIWPQSGTIEGKPGLIYSREQFSRLSRGTRPPGSSQIPPPRRARPRIQKLRKFAVQEFIPPPKPTLPAVDPIPKEAQTQRRRDDSAGGNMSPILEKPRTFAGAEPVRSPEAVALRPVDPILQDAQICRRYDSADGLTGREMEVLNGVLDNLSNRQISKMIGITERGVKFHVSNLLKKFAVRRRGDLIVLDRKRGSDSAVHVDAEMRPEFMW